MPITPSGAPAWVRTNDHTTYGGHLEKANYQSVGTVNPRTDISAANIARMAADMAAMQRTAPFAVLRYTHNDGTPAAPTVNAYQAMAGAAPTGARNGDGDASFTWAASYTDEYSVSGDVNIQFATATVNGAAGQFAVCELLDPDTNGLNERVRVRVFADTGAAVTDATVTLTVYTGPA